MDATLLIQLMGPMQSWGTASRFNVRDTEREPSKSGVIGLLCAAAGIGRDDPVPEELTSLRMGVRADREGRVLRDFQTAADVPNTEGKQPRTEVSERFYLADAAFLVGLEGPADVLRNLHEHLMSPSWPLFLGRRAFPPAAPVVTASSLISSPLLPALKQHPLLVDRDTQGERLRFQIEVRFDSPEDGPIVRRDQPLQPGFTFRTRRFTTRRVRNEFHTLNPEEATS